MVKIDNKAEHPLTADKQRMHGHPITPSGVGRLPFRVRYLSPSSTAFKQRPYLNSRPRVQKPETSNDRRNTIDLDTTTHLRQTDPNMPAQTLVFATCQHTAPLEALPRNLQTTQSNTSNSKTTYITHPSNCLTCALQLTTRGYNETKTLFGARIREEETEHMNRAFAMSNPRDRNVILANGEAEVARIVTDGDQATRAIWQLTVATWNGASRDARTASRMGGRAGEKEVLNMKLVNRDNGRLDKLRLNWRDGGGRGEVVGAQEIKL